MREKREDFIFRPHRGWTGGQKKFVLVTEWYPRNPDIAAIIRSNKSTLYRDTLNRRLFPNGSVIAGFRRRRNLGSLVAPTRPRRQPRTPRGDGGSRPCQSNRDQIHAWLVTTDKVRSPWDGRYHRIYKVLTCTTLNLIYYLICDMRHEAEASVSTGHLFTEASFKTFPCWKSTSWTPVRIRGGERIQILRGWRSVGWSPLEAWTRWRVWTSGMTPGLGLATGGFDGEQQHSPFF